MGVTHQHDASADFAEQPPPQFAPRAVLLVKSHQRTRIRERMARVVKRHAMLGEVGSRLFCTPLKEHVKRLICSS